MGVRLTAAQLDELHAETLPSVIEPVPQDERRVRAGLRAAKTGRSFEAELDSTVHGIYAREGIARLEPLNAPTVPVGPPKGSKAKKPTGPPLRRIVGAAPFDFVGSLGPATIAPGRAVAVEAKSWGKRAASLPIVSKAEAKAKGLKGKGAGIDEDNLANLAELFERWRWLPLVVWRNDGHVGILRPSVIVSVSRARAAGELRRIPRDRFFWIAPGSIDYLRPVLEWEGLRDA
jgi:hypothetical protein